jgi:hypothetical protein
MEVVGAGDDLGPAVADAFDAIAPGARGLDRRFHRLRAGVHRQAHVGAGELAQLLEERAELDVVERARGDRDLVGLLFERGHDFGMAVALVHRRVARQEVEVTTALRIPHPDAGGSLDDHREGLVVAGAVTVHQLDQLLRAHVGILQPRGERSTERRARA